MQASSVSPCVPEAARPPLFAVAVPTSPVRKASFCLQLSSATCLAPGEAVDESFARQACKESFCAVVVPVPAVDDAVVPSLAQPLASTPNNAITPNAYTERFVMMIPLLVDYGQSIVCKPGYPTPESRARTSREGAVPLQTRISTCLTIGSNGRLRPLEFPLLRGMGFVRHISVQCSQRSISNDPLRGAV